MHEMLLLPQHSQTVQSHGYTVILSGTVMKPADSPQNSSQDGSLQILRARDWSAEDVGMNCENKRIQLLLLCTMLQYRPNTTLMAQRTAMLPATRVGMHHQPSFLPEIWQRAKFEKFHI
jgi:hypothetical protein